MSGWLLACLLGCLVGWLVCWLSGWHQTNPQSTNMGSNCFQNPQSWKSKSSGIGPKRPIGEVLGDLGPKMAPRGPQERKCIKKQNIFTLLWGGKLEPKSIKKNLGAIQKVIIFRFVFWIDFEAIWCQLCSNLAPKTLPSWSQVGTKIDASWGVDLKVVLERVVVPFLSVFH